MAKIWVDIEAQPEISSSDVIDSDIEEMFDKKFR